MFIFGSGILLSISFKNSTLDISTRVASFSNAAVTLIVTFLIATCLPKSMTMVLPAAESSGALLKAARLLVPVCLSATPFSILNTTGFSSPSNSTVTQPSLMVFPEPVTGWIVNPSAFKLCPKSAVISIGVSGVIAVSAVSVNASLSFPANTSFSVSSENDALLDDATTAAVSTRACLVTVASVLLLFL